MIGVRAGSPFRIFPLAALALALGAVAASAAPAADRPWLVGVVPSAPPVAMHKSWTPLLERIQQAAGVALTLKVYEKMQDFETDLEQGVPDFAFSNPMQIVLFHAASGYAPLVRSSQPLAGILFVPAESPIRSVEDLKEKPVAFVGAKSVCSVFTRHVMALEPALKLNFRPLYSGSTANVFKAVELGKAVAGATLDSDFALLPQTEAGRFRTVLKTPTIASHPLSAHPRVPFAVREAVAAAVLALGTDSGARDLLGAVRLAEPVRADYDRDYRPLAAVDIKGLSSAP